MHDRRRQLVALEPCFPHPIRPFGPPSPLRGEGVSPGQRRTSPTCSARKRGYSVARNSRGPRRHEASFALAGRHDSMSPPESPPRSRPRSRRSGRRRGPAGGRMAAIAASSGRLRPWAARPRARAKQRRCSASGSRKYRRWPTAGSKAFRSSARCPSSPPSIVQITIKKKPRSRPTGRVLVNAAGASRLPKPSPIKIPPVGEHGLRPGKGFVGGVDARRNDHGNARG